MNSYINIVEVIEKYLSYNEGKIPEYPSVAYFDYLNFLCSLDKKG
jgi:hypothetical protein